MFPCFHVYDTAPSSLDASSDDFKHGMFRYLLELAPLGVVAACTTIIVVSEAHLERGAHCQKGVGKRDSVLET